MIFEHLAGTSGAIRSRARTESAIRLLHLIIIVCFGAVPAHAADVSAVHDPAAGEELERAFKKLERLKSYRLRSTSIPHAGEPLIYEVQPPDRYRMFQRVQLAGFPGTAETVSIRQRIAFRFVSSELDAHLAKMSTAEQSSFMATMAGPLVQIVEAIASGGVWGLGFAAERAASLASALRDQAKENPLEVYGKWQCTEDAVPAEDWTKKSGETEQTELVERLSPETLDGENVRVYRSVSTVENELNDSTWSLNQRTYVLAHSGLPRRVETDDTVFDYYDFELPLTIEFPACEKRL